MSLPAFINIPEAEQAGELRSFLKEKGADISETMSEEGLELDLESIIDNVGVVWKLPDVNEIEGVFNSILSLLIYFPPETMEKLVPKLSEHITKSGTAEQSYIRIKILNSLFHGVGETNPLAYHVYCGMLRVAAKYENIDQVVTDLDKVKKWTVQWELNRDRINNVYRLLYEGLKESKQSDEASIVMVELLGTYTEDNASQARDEANRCIVNAIADPQVYLFDHLLTLRPVKFLEGERIHDLLTIFVSGRLDDYMNFFNSNQDFIKGLGLSHDAMIKKMRILTFMGMAVDVKEISFDTLQQELKMSEDDVEGFVIDVVKSKMAKAKIDQLQNKVNVSFVTHRTFGRQQWQQLREHLVNWQNNLSQVEGRLDSLQQQMMT
ncbi:eukaryotic translation initiation factor 3 subunit M-like [Lytechinus variegatus]|uniref:eukaryotic translation initiation factor 3 subunit M-like n=1 Tax=Lytechinus variegatus TaxID=7654 RepID=UPI001BB1638D|nr:eukaryotic translation initiation factor 3 subunit M-like [Lytechinus variegatus]